MQGSQNLGIDFLLNSPENAGREGGIRPIITSTVLILLVCLKEKVNFVSKPIQLAGMLAEGRVDIVVSENSTMLKLLLEYKKLPKVKPLNKVYILPKPISQVELYHWVHKSNESMIPLLDQELVKMKKDRVIERAKERYTNRLLELVNQ